MYNIKAAAIDPDLKESIDEEYSILLGIIEPFLNDIYRDTELGYINYELMAKKASFAIKHAIEGFGLLEEDVFALLKTKDDNKLTPEQIKDKEFFKSLIANLIDFSVAEEYQALEDIMSKVNDSEDYDDFKELALTSFKKYNKMYTAIEMSDLIYAIGVTKVWRTIDDDQIIEYRTQRDERVRDLHMSFDGIRYRKRDFPAGLVPPIDHGCRCFLVNTGSIDGRKLTNRSNVSESIDSIANKTFSSNLAESGVMFSSSHPYFNVPLSKAIILKLTSDRIKKDNDVWST